MKKSFTILIAIFLFISCNENKEDNKEDNKYLSFITAGQNNGIGIEYTDVVPDDDSLGFYPSPTTQTKFLDLNNDQINDFELILNTSAHITSSSKFAKLEIKPLGKNAVCTSILENNWVNDFTYNDTIGENSNWSDSTALLYYYYWTMGDHGNPPLIKDSLSIKGYWYDSDSIYIGVKISKNNIPFFGWIDMKKKLLRQYAITIPY